DPCITCCESLHHQEGAERNEPPQPLTPSATSSSGEVNEVNMYRNTQTLRPAFYADELELVQWKRMDSVNVQMRLDREFPFRSPCRRNSCDVLSFSLRHENVPHSGDERSLKAPTRSNHRCCLKELRSPGSVHNNKTVFLTVCPTLCANKGGTTNK